MNRNVGTNDVEKYVKNVCKHNVQKKRNIGMIKNAMKMKLEDAEYDEKNVRKDFIYKLSEYKKATIRGSSADVEFRTTMKYEVEEVWNVGKQKNRDKVNWLVKKYAPVNANGNIRDVIVTDEKLSEMSDTSETAVKKFGGVEISDVEKVALRLDPEYRVYKRIDEVDIEVEIEKGCTKARYHLMGESDKDPNHAQDNTIDQNGNDFKPFDLENKVANYGNIRATDLPTVQRLYPPKPSTIRREVIMQNVKDKMLNKAREYIEEKCNEKGYIKKSNISNDVKDGIKSLKNRVKEKEVVVFTTDKTGEFSIDTTDNYLEVLNEHTQNDKKINEKKVKIIENRCNDHLKQFNKMLVRRAGG